ncbi:MAG: type II toxin-antitoxin system Phd/YefM family antitoxin [Candidatus Hydrogenedentes bacterium]|nr:type II toxin-antitoxin system Phd/YefM family antitoxin [Candidatus Hydrogenedentota bacterium]
MTHVTEQELKSDPEAILRTVAEVGEPILVQVRGQDIAAIVPLEDLAFLEETENRLDLEAYRRAMRDLEEGRDELIPWEQAKKELGLD